MPWARGGAAFAPNLVKRGAAEGGPQGAALDGLARLAAKGRLRVAPRVRVFP